jgi:hypothetical protein
MGLFYIRQHKYRSLLDPKPDDNTEGFFTAPDWEAVTSAILGLFSPLAEEAGVGDVTSTAPPFPSCVVMRGQPAHRVWRIVSDFTCGACGVKHHNITYVECWDSVALGISSEDQTAKLP